MNAILMIKNNIILDCDPLLRHRHVWISLGFLYPATKFYELQFEFKLSSIIPLHSLLTLINVIIELNRSLVLLQACIY